MARTLCAVFRIFISRYQRIPMLFLTIFAVMLILFFGLVDPWLKKHKRKVDYLKTNALFQCVFLIWDVLRRM
jgi:hypothetical protein